MSDELRKKFLEQEWAGTTPCDNCPNGHDACLQCGGIKPGVPLMCISLERFGHQIIDQGDYKDDCVYAEVENSMRWTLESMADDAERQRLRDTCKVEGHVQGAESIGLLHTETVAITPKYTCLRCETAYTGKKRKVRQGDFPPA